MVKKKCAKCGKVHASGKHSDEAADKKLINKMVKKEVKKKALK